MQLARTPGPYRGVLLVVLLAGLVQAGPPAPGQDQGEKTAEKTFTVAELDQAVAPIALYPDSLVSQILMAATYPLEIVQASRWVQANPKLKGDALTKELEKQKWDPSVKSLVNFPDVLKMMSDKLDWTQQLGDAMLSQQKDVMAAVQRLRTKAIEAGNLKTTEQQKVIVEKKIIVIQAASPQVVYVPVYNPVVVYGAWPLPGLPALLLPAARLRVQRGGGFRRGRGGGRGVGICLGALRMARRQRRHRHQPEPQGQPQYQPEEPRRPDGQRRPQRLEAQFAAPSGRTLPKQRHGPGVRPRRAHAGRAKPW